MSCDCFNVVDHAQVVIIVPLSVVFHCVVLQGPVFRSQVKVFCLLFVCCLLKTVAMAFEQSIIVTIKFAFAASFMLLHRGIRSTCLQWWPHTRTS